MSLGLQPDRVHVVAGVPLERVELAELVVLDQQVDEEPLPAAPGALQPAVVGALVGQRVRRRPVLERRPADRVVARLAGQERLQDRAVAPGQRVVRAVDQRVRRAVLVPGPAAVAPPPRNSKAMPWVCASTYPRTSWYGVTPACGSPRDVDLDLGVGGCSRWCGSAGTRRAPVDAQRRPSLVKVAGRRASRAVQTVVGAGLRRALAAGGHELPVGVVEQVVAEVGGLEEDRSPPRRACSSRRPSRSGPPGARARGRAAGRWSARVGRPRSRATYAAASATFCGRLVGSWRAGRSPAREIAFLVRRVVRGRGGRGRPRAAFVPARRLDGRRRARSAAQVPPPVAGDGTVDGSA